MDRRLLALAALALLSVHAPAAEASHGGTIRVTSDADLVAPHWTGSGTADDPARLAIAAPTPSGGYALDISNTRKHLNLSGLVVSGGGASSDGIRLTNVTNVTVWGSTLASNAVGIHVKRSADVVVAGSTIKTSGTGIHLEESRNVTLRDNRIALNDKDVRFRLSPGNTLIANNLSTATGQVGLFFDDNLSYGNHIPETNVVNGIPVRWYSGVSGLVRADVDVSLVGITNVAQIMIHNATDVVLERPVTKSGIGHGIVVHRSERVALTAPVAESNARDGIVVELSNGTRVANASARDNGGAGVSLASATDTLVEWSAITGNLREGLAARNATGRTTAHHLTFASNAQRGVVIQSSGNFTLDASSLTHDALLLESARDVTVRGTTLAGAAPTGLSLSRSSGRFEGNTIQDRATAVSFVASTRSNFTGNAITMGSVGFSFDGPASYDNDIAPSNVVNGTPVRWYTNVAGPVRVENVSVELRGITNVAQIAVHRSTNLTLVSPTAANGTAAGILVWGSHDVNLTGAQVASNAFDGVLVDGGSGLRMHDGRVRANGGDGLKLRGAAGALVENSLVEANRGRGVHAEMASAPVVRGNAIRGNVGPGISLDRVGPGGAAIEHNTVAANAGGGVLAAGSTVGTIASNNLASNGQDGIALSSVPPGAYVGANAVEGHLRGIRLRAAAGTQLVANAVTMQPGAWGFHFDDEASYDVSAPPSNTVNGVPLRWYVRASDTTIAGIASELAGITNVAQVMLLDSARVVLEDAVATNGTARGIYVLRSGNVTVQGGRVENNTDAGLGISASHDARVNATLALGGRAVGVRVEGAQRASIENLTVRSNVGGVDVVNASSLERLTNSTFADNGLRGVMINASTARLVQANALSGHVRAFQLDATRGAHFAANNVTLRANDTAWHFVTPAAHENDVGETNVVDGVPMRWYSRLSNATLSGVRAELRGLTNVGQIGLISTENVTLLDARASHGLAHGVYVEGGNVTRILGGAAEGNARDGVHLSRVNGARVQDTTVAANDVGVRTIGTRGAVIEDIAARAQARDAIADDGSAQLRIVRGALESSGAHGVNAVRTQGLDVSGLTVRAANGSGIRAAEVANLRASSNVVEGAKAAGISIEAAAAGARVDSNRVSNATDGIRLARTEFADVRGNVISIAPGQTGLRFDDETSYNNVVPTSNTVNGAPVHWYTGLAGTQALPVTLAGLRSEVAGITNVAQIMLYRSSYVGMPDLVATNGTGRGVYLYRSSAIQLEGANVSGNAIAGVELYATQSSALRNATSSGSATGVRLLDSMSNVVSAIDAKGAAIGVHLNAGSRDNCVDRIETDGSARGLVDEGWNGNGLPGNNALADAGAPKRIRVGAPLAFADPTATYRHESDRIVEQRWSWGDGTPETTSAAAQLLKPSHTWSALGRYRAELAVTMADGVVLKDDVWVDVVSALEAPLGLAALSGDGNATLTWAPPASDGGLPIQSYRVYRGENATALALLATVTTPRYLDAGLANGRAYTYAVAAVNAEGEGPRALATAAPAGVPAAPTALVAKAGAGHVNLSWQAPTASGGHPIGAYAILRASGGAPFARVALVPNVTAYADVGLANGIAYTYAVRAVNILGEGPASTNATATPVGPPGTPLSLRALGGDASVVLQWSAPSDHGGLALTGYRVWRAVGEGALVELPTTLAANASSWRDTGLSNGERYSYAVSAMNPAGAGALSARANATPEAVDTLKPLVYAHAPAPGAQLLVSPLRIAAEFVDNDGVVATSVRLYLDGALVGAQATNGTAVYSVPAPLSAGDHTVRLVLADASGNEANETWTFRILSPDEVLPRIEESGHSIAPSVASPGDNVTARVSLRNAGHAPGNATVQVAINGTILGSETFALEPGASREVVFIFPAPEFGLHVVELGDATLALAVLDVVPLPDEPGEEPPEPMAEPEPRRPVRSIPPPREELETPLPAVAALGALAAAAGFFRRRR